MWLAAKSSKEPNCYYKVRSSSTLPLSTSYLARGNEDLRFLIFKEFDSRLNKQVLLANHLFLSKEEFTSAGKRGRREKTPTNFRKEDCTNIITAPVEACHSEHDEGGSVTSERYQPPRGIDGDKGGQEGDTWAAAMGRHWDQVWCLSYSIDHIEESDHCCVSK